MVTMVSFTGHRHCQLSDVKASLDESAQKYGNDVVWICGGAIGLDSHAAQYAMENKIRLWLVLPFTPEAMSKYWNPAQRKVLEDTIKYAEKVDILSSVYNVRFYQIRNEKMVDSSEVLCAFFNGSPGGTANCIRYARHKRHPVEVYNPKQVVAV